MKNLASDILKRIKRLWILLIVLPLLTGAISYYLESRETTSYTGEAILSLGNFENTKMTDANWVAKHILRDEVLLKEVLSASKSNLEIETVKEMLQAEVEGSKEVKLSVTGLNKEEVNNIISSVVDGFMALSKETWQEKYDLINERIEATNASDKVVDGAQKQEILYEFQEIEDALESGETIVMESISISTNYINPPKRALFGVLIGIMLNILILFLPELFRSDSKR